MARATRPQFEPRKTLPFVHNIDRDLLNDTSIGCLWTVFDGTMA
jgi:hypothetical protein